MKNRMNLKSTVLKLKKEDLSMSKIINTSDNEFL